MTSLKRLFKRVRASDRLRPGIDCLVSDLGILRPAGN
jgi:hypothetical protein